MHIRLAAIALSAVTMAFACTPVVHTSAVATAPAAAPSTGPVRVSAMIVPRGVPQLGIVQAHSDQTDITQIMPSLVKQVADLGGNYLKIDDITTTYGMQTRSRTENYSCGTSKYPRTCTRTVTETVEVPTTRILGRAYRTAT
jgi:hypothetical protein